MSPFGRIGCLLLCATVLCARPTPARADDRAIEIRPCRQVLVRVERPEHRQVGEELGAFVCEQARRMTPLFHLNKGQLVLVRMAGSANAFARLTGKSFYTLAVFRSRGLADMIVTQPAEALGDRKKIQAVLTHELTHLMIRRSIGPRCPTWINEGLAQWFEGRRTSSPAPADEGALGALEKRWHDASTPVAQRRSDYRASLAAVAHLIGLVGEGTFLEAVLQLKKSRRVLDLDLEGRSLAMRLFIDRPDGEGHRTAQDPDTRPADEPGMTRLPLHDMLERAKKKKKQKR